MIWAQQSSAVSVPKLNDHQLKAWKRILFYGFDLIGRERSLFDTENFFLAMDGNTDPVAELQALIEAAQSNENANTDQHARCRFPRRVRWVQEELGLLSDLPPIKCLKLSFWVGPLTGSKAALVYSSQYLGNPASAFGHVLLLFRRAGAGKKIISPMMDIAIGFAAIPDTQNPFLYLVKGLAGGFPGVFTSSPYFAKIQEYNNYERRDLWEYDLNLSTEEEQSLTEIIWEAMPGHVDYFFFNTNCATLVIKSLEAATGKPVANTDSVIWVSPFDLVFSLNRSNIVSAVYYRPSIAAQVVSRYKELSDPEKLIFHDIIDNNKLNVNLLPDDPTRKARIIDTALDYIDCDERIAGSAVAEKFAGLRKRLLIERASIEVASSPIAMKDPSQGIHNAHSESLLSYSYGRLKQNEGDENHNFHQISLRPTFHSFGEFAGGLDDLSSVRSFSPTLRMYENKKFTLESFEFFSLESRLPFDGVLNPVSTSFSFALQNARNTSEELTNGVNEIYGHAAKGIAFAAFSNLLIIHGNAGGLLGIIPEQPEDSRIAPRIQAGIFFRVAERLSLQLRQTSVRQFQVLPWRAETRHQADVEIILSPTREWQAKAAYMRESHLSELSLSMGIFF